jgi:hypothetical protein
MKQAGTGNRASRIGNRESRVEKEIGRGDRGEFTIQISGLSTHFENSKNSNNSRNWKTMSDEYGKRIAQAAMAIMAERPPYSRMTCDQLVIRAHKDCGYTYDRPKLLNEIGHERVSNPKAGDVIAVNSGQHWGIMISSSEFVHARGLESAENVQVGKVSDLHYWTTEKHYLRYW